MKKKHAQDRKNKTSPQIKKLERIQGDLKTIVTYLLAEKFGCYRVPPLVAKDTEYEPQIETGLKLQVKNRTRHNAMLRSKDISETSKIYSTDVLYER